MPGKKALLASAVVASVILILVVGSIPIAAKEGGKGKKRWEMTVPGPLGTVQTQFLSFSDFEAERMHYGMPVIAPEGTVATLSIDVDYIKTTGDFTNNLHATARKIRILLTPGDPPLPVSAEIRADQVTADLFFSNEPDPDTGEYGEFTAVLEGSVTFSLIIAGLELPPWWVTPPIYSNDKFTIHLTFVQPDYEISFIPESLQLWSDTTWDPPRTVETDIEFTVTPTTEFVDPVGIKVEVEPGLVTVDYDSSQELPPFTRTIHVRSSGNKICTGGKLVVNLEGPNLPPGGVRNGIQVEVRGHFDGFVLPPYEPPEPPPPKVQLPNDGVNHYLADVVFHRNEPDAGDQAVYLYGASNPDIQCSLTQPDDTPVPWGEPQAFTYDDPDYPLGVFKAKLWFSTTVPPGMYSVQVVVKEPLYGENYLYPLDVEVIAP